MKRNYGWKPDLPDYRDKMYYSHLFKVSKLPVKVDLRSKCPPVVDQGNLGSCTGNSLAGALGFIHNKELFSRLFIYYNERSEENDILQDNGAQLRTGIKTLSQYGAPSESLWPYVENQFSVKPNVASYSDAIKNKISSYYRIEGIDQAKHCLSEGFPFVMGFTVYDGFDSNMVAETGYLNFPVSSESVQGGHAVLCCGYGTVKDFIDVKYITKYKLNDAEPVVLIKNSWGMGWGVFGTGYFTMPMTYFGNNNLVTDCWCIKG